MSRTAQPAPTVSLKLVMRWSDQHHLDCFKHNLQFQGQFVLTSLRPVLGTELAIDSVLLKMEQLMSWLRSGHRAVSFFPLVAVIISAKQLRNVHRTL